jgi:predicted nucleic acid-binding protein
MKLRVVLDTNIFIGACLGVGASNQTLAAGLKGLYLPLMGSSLFLEHEAVLGRDALFATCRLSPQERSELLDIYLVACEWTRIYFGWRPNLRDEGDNHLLELAVAGGVHCLVTRNLRDFAASELKFPRLRIVSPETFLKELLP